MQYRRDKKGNELSVLGYGCMRFTKNGSSVDLDKAEKEVMAAIKAGVNYFDTAYVYAGNEAAVGEILDRNHCREQIYLATKLPHYLIKSVAGAEKMFQEELRRLKTDYIDYYLMHMLTDIPTWEKIKKDRHAGLDRGKISVRSDQKYRIFLSWKYRDVQTARGCLRLGFLPDPVQLYG